jgi:hypothetical protein
MRPATTIAIAFLLIALLVAATYQFVFVFR